jgi:cardiolipin synthase A/B
MLAPYKIKGYRYYMQTTPNHPAFPGKRFRVQDHDIHILVEPEIRLQAVLSVIGGASQSIRMFSYMFRDDETGREILAALIASAQRGIRVSLMIDSFGSEETKHAFFEPLIAAGGRYHCFSSRWNLGYIVRNHQKILIADEKHAVIGGFNITDHYFGRAGDESWQDFGVIISGANVAAIADYYDQLDDLSCDGGIHYRKLRKLIREWQPGNGALQWLLGGPTNRISPWALRLKRNLEIAESVDIVSAYFTPSQSILRRIAKVTRKGKSRLILAGKTDNKATIGAARSLYKYLLKRGANIYEFQTRPLHMKMLVIDDACYIGSSNLDVRSLFINLEIMLRIEDKNLADYLRSIVTDMADQSEKQTLLLHSQRAGFWHRMLWFGKYFLVNSVDYTIGRRIKFSLMRK